MRTGELGYWWRSLGGPPPRRPPLPAAMHADVAIVGAGYTGLWSAYYLKRARPELEIVILEREHAGYGASGRNGGWVSGFFAGPPRVYEKRAGAAGYAAMQRAMFETVEEIAAVLAEHRIDADFVKGGRLEVALGDAQLLRLRQELAAVRAHAVGEEDLRELSRRELPQRLRVAGARGASFSPHVARVHPAKLLAGLASTVERLGVRIYEGTPVSAIRPHEALTPAGAVGASWIVRATEGYTAGLSGLRRALVPMNSSMIVTEPLDAGVWEEIGWGGCEALSDGAHVYVYLQRTADGRIAIGGRGVPYRFGSRTDRCGETAPRTVASLHAKLRAMFPAAADAKLEHAWSGVLGVPRDWCASVDADPRSGLAWAGGYVGEGVAAANLAGRTLRDLVLGERTALTTLPWVGRRPRRWEPEPVRWSAIRSVYALYRQADLREQRTQRPSRLGRAVDAISGRACEPAPPPAIPELHFGCRRRRALWETVRVSEKPGLSEHAALNRRLWDEQSLRYQATHGPQLAHSGGAAWGVWQLAESELRVLGEVRERDVLELGCGAAQWSIALHALGARVTGLDNSAVQLEHARSLMAAGNAEFPLVHASAEATPFADASFDIVFCDHGAMTFADPRRTVPEAARVLRPGGLLAFSMSTPILDLAWEPGADHPGERLAVDYWTLHALEEPGEPVSFQLPYGDWIALFRESGLIVESLIELRPPADATSSYRDAHDLAWARRWPMEHIWRVRRYDTRASPAETALVSSRPPPRS